MVMATQLNCPNNALGALLSSIKQPTFWVQSSLFVPPRIDSPELLDQGIGTDEDVRANFADLWRINRYLGGVQAITQHLYPRLLAHAGTNTLVDIGTGSGDIGAVITRWAGQQRIDLKRLQKQVIAASWFAVVAEKQVFQHPRTF